MQWLINIILELVEPMLAALKVTIHGQLGYFDRGDTGAPDWTDAILVADAAWHTIDVSGIVPPDTKAIVLHLGTKSPSVAKQIWLRTNSTYRWPTWAQHFVAVANLPNHEDKTISLDPDLKFDYYITHAGWNYIQFTITGWWLR